MDKATEIWHGEWWFPCNDNDQPFKISGTLTCVENEKPILELLLSSNAPLVSCFLLGIQPVILGADMTGEKYTVFNARGLAITASSVTLSTDYFVIGAHLNSMDEKCILRATVNFPNLKYWVLYKRIFIEQTDEETKLIVKNNPPANTLAVEVDDGLTWNFRSQLQCNPSEYEWHIAQDTDFGIRPLHNISINQVLQHAVEFSQFLSVAMLSKQAPSHIFLWTEDKVETRVKLLFKQEPCAGGIYWRRLIQYAKMSDKIPAMLKQWHTLYEQIAPICTYLINSLENKSSFGAPDFLIVAQAIDGYCKRFISTDSSKKRPSYKEKIEKLLKYFEKVELVTSCKIQPEVLADTRNKYSHLAPDDEEWQNAVSSVNELRGQTTKAQILLICCLLNSIGLSIDEINTCFNGADLKNWI